MPPRMATHFWPNKVSMGNQNVNPIGKTPHAEAVRLMELGWRWNGRKYANREAWHNAMHKSFFEKMQATVDKSLIVATIHP